MSHATVLVAVDGPEDKIEEQVAHEMQPFDETAEECFADGTRWDWYVIGGRWDGHFDGKNIIQRKHIDLDKLHREYLGELTETWTKAQSEKHHRELIYGVKDDETLSDYLARKAGKPEQSIAYYAFLHNRHWHEAERMGWFGISTATECERKNPDYPLDNNKCLHIDEKTGARIINWQEPNEIWTERFFKRFIEPLSPEKFLVLVDYHV